MIIHDIIKIMYTEYGYLPNYPYHLISDEEMIEAFQKDESGYFVSNYTCVNSDLSDAYDELFDEIKFHLHTYLDSDKTIAIPDWVYSYMIGSAICDTSNQIDKHDLFTLLNLDNTNDEFTADIQKSIYDVSTAWLRKLPESKRVHRPPTMFGEPHVIKSLRLG